MYFRIGSVFATKQVLSHLRQHLIAPLDLLLRHLSGDFGDVCKEDALANQQAILQGGRILSAYVVGGERVYVITESDRSATTLLMACEY